MESDKEREEDRYSLIPCPGVLGHHHFTVIHRPLSFPFCAFHLNCTNSEKHGGKVRNGRDGSFMSAFAEEQKRRERILDASRVTSRQR